MDKRSSGVGSVFLVRNFRLVFFGALVSDFGAVLYSFAAGFYILEISGNNAFLQGLYLALCSAVLLLSTPIGGVLGDRCSKARIMFVCDYLKGGLILMATLGILCFPNHGAQLAILFAAGLLGNAVSGVFSPSAGALLPHIVAENQLQQANAYYSAKSALQNIVGVVLAGVLYAALPIHALFLIVGSCYVLSGVSEMFIRYEHVSPPDKLTLRLVFTDMRDGLRYLRRESAIMALMTAVLFVNFFVNPVFGNFIPYFVRTDLAGASTYLFDRLLTPELWSSVFSMLAGISMLAGSLILSVRKQEDLCGYKTALRLCMTAAVLIALTIGYWALVSLGISLTAFLLLFCLENLLTGYLIACINIPVNTAIMRAVDRDMLSKVTSILNILSMGLVPIASVMAGGVLQVFGSASLLLICSAGFAVTAVSLLFSRQARAI